MQKRITKKAGRESETVLYRATRKQIRERATKERLTIGLDLGDRNSSYCVLSEAGEILLESALPTTKAGLGQVLEGMAQCRIALEVGTHSPWVSRYLESLGHETIVANPRNVAFITRSTQKTDRLDARKLARLARVDTELLSPIRHRGEAAQLDLAVLRGRDLLVRERTRLVISARSMVKAVGERLKACAPEAVTAALVKEQSAEIRRFAEPLLKMVETLNEQIAVYDAAIGEMYTRYPEVKLLDQVYGIGPLIALTFLLTIEDPDRFAHSRDVGPYFGFRPKKRDSGESQPELGISKEGDKMVRWLLVQAAHTNLRRGAPDSDVRRWGMAMLEQKDREAKKKGQRRGKKKVVVVAMARKLAVLLHRLWVTGEVYDPLYSAKQAARKAKAKAGGKSVKAAA
jgi:transposase